MSNSYQRVPSDGTMVLLDISIDYLDRDEITVYFDDVLTTAWIWSGTSDKRILFPTPVPNGVVVMVKRTTDASKLRHVFSEGAKFTAPNLDEDLKQALHMAQEASEANLVGDFFTDINLHGYRLYNVGPAVDDTDAVTLGQIRSDSTTAVAAAAAAAASATAAATSAAGAAAAAQGVRDDLLNTSVSTKGFGMIKRRLSGTGAVDETLAGVTTNIVRPESFGALGDNTGDDSLAINAAQAALTVMGGGTVLYTRGKTYRVANPILHYNGITHDGSGLSTLDSNGTAMGARIVSSVSDVFNNTGTINAGFVIKNLWIESQVGGGHIFNWTGSGLTAKVRIHGCTMIQRNPAKSVINGKTTNGVFSIYLYDLDYQYEKANTVPAIHLKSDTINSVHIHDFWSHCSLGETSGTYSIQIESTNATGPAFNVNIRQGVFEIPGGGAISLLSARQSCIEDCGIYDLLVPPANPLFVCAKAASGPTTSNVSFRRLFSNVGTVTVPDLRIDCSVAGQSGFVVENCRLSYMDQVSANGASVLVIGGEIANRQNSATLDLGASAGQDIKFASQAAACANWTIHNGTPSNRPGHLSFDLNGAYAGGFTKTGLFQWGGTFSAPSMYVLGSGAIFSKERIYPGNTAGVDQANCGLLAGAGVPAAGYGNNGDVYFRSDGGTGSTIYHRRAGAWVAIL